MHLNEIKQRFPKAFKAYVEMLIEDCTDQFFVKDNVLCVAVDGCRDSEELEAFHDGDTVMEWRPSKTRKTMDVGSGWEFREDGLDEETDYPAMEKSG